MNREELHNLFVDKSQDITEWFARHSEGYKLPVYGSMDIRESSYKVAPVDANVFPAGFNNICEVDRENAPEIFGEYFKKHYPSNIKRLLLLAEVNTKNLFYWDNVFTLHHLLTRAGFEVRVGVPEFEDFPSEIQTASGRLVTVENVTRKAKNVHMKSGFQPDMIICNNDFSTEYQGFIENLEIPMNPPYKLGWHNRKKDRHFYHYNALASDLAEHLGVDPWYFTIKTEKFSGFDMTDETNRSELAQKVQSLVDSLKEDFNQRNIKSTPTVFVKNNTGTYGMGVTQVGSGDDIINWSNRSRKKMKQGKGGVPIAELILQEGIPSIIKDKEGLVAEPVMYLVGCELVGGFLRSHKKKGEEDNLNSPGAVFKRLCTSDLKLDEGSSPMENVYGLFAKLAQLAITREIEELKAPFPGYS